MYIILGGTMVGNTVTISATESQHSKLRRATAVKMK